MFKKKNLLCHRLYWNSGEFQGTLFRMVFKVDKILYTKLKRKKKLYGNTALKLFLNEYNFDARICILCVR
jgi:hypothetical protein